MLQELLLQEVCMDVKRTSSFIVVLRCCTDLGRLIPGITRITYIDWK